VAATRVKALGPTEAGAKAAAEAAQRAVGGEEQDKR